MPENCDESRYNASGLGFGRSERRHISEALWLHIASVSSL